MVSACPGYVGPLVALIAACTPTSQTYPVCMFAPVNTDNAEAWASTISYPWTLLVQLGLETFALAAIAAFSA